MEGFSTDFLYATFLEIQEQSLHDFRTTSLNDLMIKIDGQLGVMAKIHAYGYSKAQ